jgi:hypothetical protein
MSGCYGYNSASVDSTETVEQSQWLTSKFISMCSTKLSPLVFDFQVNYLSAAVRRSIH